MNNQKRHEQLGRFDKKIPKMFGRTLQHFFLYVYLDGHRRTQTMTI